MIIATFPAGVAALTVHGLHQWDYGQSLKVSCADLSGAFEVHFSNVVLKTAYIRSCSQGASVAIPDVLLQQPYDILAWVCEIGAGRSRALHTLRIPVTPRPRPENQEEVITPAEKSQFKAMMAEFNATVDYWLDGVKETNNGLKLKHWYGTQAEYNALPSKDDLTVYVISDDLTLEGIRSDITGLKTGAVIAGVAQNSLYASRDAKGNEIHSTYGNFSAAWSEGASGSIYLTAAGTYEFKVYVTEADLTGGCSTILLTWDGVNIAKAVARVLCYDDEVRAVNLVITDDGRVYLETRSPSNPAGYINSVTAIQYRRVC